MHKNKKAKMSTTKLNFYQIFIFKTKCTKKRLFSLDIFLYIYKKKKKKGNNNRLNQSRHKTNYNVLLFSFPFLKTIN